MEVSWQDLICLPDGEAVAALRKSWNWLLPEPWEPLLFSALGDVFLKQSSEEIFWLNCGTAELSRVAGNSGEFEAILGTAVADNWFMPDLIKELRFEGKIPSTGQCYTYAIFPIFSEGKYEAGNLNVVPCREHFNLSGCLHFQTARLADGQKVQIRLEPGN
jgi:hypothetical protein